ncbi:MAG TPA: NfeD family protein [Gallionella sp.]
MEAYWVWWMFAVVLVIAEILSGTFYLIAIAFGLAAAGLAAYLGIGWVGQTAVAALLCTASVAAIYRWKRGRGGESGQANLAYDIGQTVQVVSWADERHARVSYRGAEWVAELAATATPDAARRNWRIREVAGSRLIIE